MSKATKPPDVADYLGSGGDFEAALARAVPLRLVDDEEPPPLEEGYLDAVAGEAPTVRQAGSVDRAREAIRAALVALGAPQTTREERASVAADLSRIIPELAELAHAAPAEWAGAVVSLAACGGFGGHIERLDRAVKLSAATLAEVSKAASKRRDPERSVNPDPSVLRRLAMTDQGKPKASYANVCRVFAEDGRWASLRMNAYGEDIERDGERWPEAAGTAEAAIWLSDAYGLDATEGAVKSAIHATASGRIYNPVTDYLDSVRGKASGAIRRLLPEVLGITDASDLHRAMLGRWLISCVARARNPGAKCDAILVLVGRQGAKKSTFFATLGGAFFGDSPLDIGTKEAPIVFSRFWIYELAEMDGITSSREATEIKHFAAVRSDTYRAPYARGAGEHKRRTVFCGSVNKGDFLVDPTGNRRFYCLTVPDGWVVPVPLLESLRDAVWAEAQDLYEEGERWWFDRAEDEVREEDAQRYVEEDPWQPLIERWLVDNGLVPFTLTRILEMGLKLDAPQITRQARVRAAAILRRLQYEDRPSPAGYRGSRVWMRSSR